MPSCTTLVRRSVPQWIRPPSTPSPRLLYKAAFPCHSLCVHEFFHSIPLPHSVHFDEALSIWASSAAKLHHLPPSTWVMLTTLQLSRLVTQKSPTRRSSSKIIRLEHVHVTLIQSWREGLYASSTGMYHLLSHFYVSLATTTVFPVQRILDFGKHCA